MHRSSTLSLLALGVLSPAVACAHHSRAPYDLTREVVFDGTVTKLDWKNPHTFLTIETRDPSGEMRLQEIEVMSVSEARAMGLSRDAIASGAHVIVRAHPGRAGPGARAVGLDVRTDDGVVHPLNVDAGARSTIARPVGAQAQGLAGRWVPTLETLHAFYPAALQSMPLTETGRAVRAAAMSRDVAGTAFLGRCEPFPPPMLSVFPDLRAIDVAEEAVVMRFEAQGMNLERVIHMNQTEHPADVAPSIMGHSIGRWAGESLVIDTAAFAPHDVGIFQVPSTPDTRLVERLTLRENRLQLEYSFTLEDPEYLAEPFSFTAIWDHRPDLEPSSEACDPEIAQRALEE